MKSLSLLLPDLRIQAPGCPEPLLTYALSRALSRFLDETEAWREWGPVRTVGDIGTSGPHGDRDGLLVWDNHLDDASQRWVYVKRIDMLKWVPTGQEVKFKTAAQLQEWDSDWRTTTGALPMFFAHEGEGATGTIQARVYPIIDTTVDSSYEFLPRFVLGTEVSSGTGQFSTFDTQLPQIPDRLFRAYREAIVSGAMAILTVIPGRDWTDAKLAMYHAGVYERLAADARARAVREFGHTDSLVRYGGY